MIAAWYKAPASGCCAGRLCEFDNSGHKPGAPSDDWPCLCCEGIMHETDTCGEFMDNILNEGTVLLYGYLPNAAAAVFKDALAKMIWRNNHPVSVKDVWRSLQETVICHKCFEDYIKI
jgi:hypothetical protein